MASICATAGVLEAALRKFHRAGLLVMLDIHNEDRAAELDPAWQEAFTRFFHALLDAGHYLAPSAFEAGFVSAAHSADDIAATIAAAEAVFKSWR